MRKFSLILLFSMMTYALAGCVAITSMTTEKFGENTAIEIFNILSTVNDAAEKYFLEKGEYPSRGLDELVDEGYLGQRPSIDAAYYESDVTPHVNWSNEYATEYPGGPNRAAHIQDLKDGVCNVFTSQYSSVPELQGVLWDYARSGEAYPAATYGVEAKIFALKWYSEDLNRCEVFMVTSY